MTTLEEPHIAGATTNSVSTGKKQELLLRLLREQAGAGSREGLGTVAPDPASRHDPFPLTEIQQAYWIGRSCAYEFGDVSIHAYVEVDGGDVDLPRLQDAWQSVVARHDMLRAVVLPDGRQRILPEVAPYAFEVTDLRGLGERVVAQKLTTTREELSHQVLPAERWPGFDIRATLLDGGRTRVHISLDLLHIDGGSLMILVDDWMRLYREPGTDLPPLELSYRDFVLGQVALRESPAYRQSATYWQERIASLPPAPALPTRATATTGRTRFHRRTATLEPVAWQRLKARAGQSGLTPSSILLTAYADVLANWSKDDAFTVNVTLFNRLPIHEQVNRILGDFTSMILLEVASDPQSTFTDRALALQKRLWAGLDHRHVSGVQVLRELARVQKPAARALMPIVFTSMLDLAAQGFRPPWCSLRGLGEVVYSVTQTPQVWLDHQVLDDDGTLVLTWDAVEDLFPEGLLDDMFAAYGRMLRRLADDDGAWREPQGIELPAGQAAQRLAVNATEVAVPESTLPELFLRQAQLRPDDPAIITSGRTLTYGEVRQRANRLGHALRDLGVKPGTLVAVVMDKGWEQMVGTLGVHLAGGAYLPVDPELPAERRDYLLKDGGVRVAVTQSWLDRDLRWPAGVERIHVDVAEPSTMDETWLAPVQRPDDLSHVIYTSGSTGLPKGVMIEHRNVVNRIADVNRRLDIGPRDRVLGLTALHHDLSVYDIFGVLAAGAATVLPDAARVRDPGHWARLMARHGVTLWNSVPTFLQMLVEYLEQRSAQVELLPQSLRCAVLAGDWIPLNLPARLRALGEGVQVIASGGPTETTIWDIWYPVGDVHPDWPSIPYGKPMDNTRYHVLDRALRPRPVWAAGELYIAGAGLGRGYWRDERLTRARFITHPETGERLYRSGDLGRYLPDGNIEFLGREDLQVKIGGHRIELAEIEAVLGQHPGVHAAAVSAAGEPGQPRRLVAFVVPKKTPTERPGKDPADFKQQQLAGISILNPVERIEFKLNQWGIRRDTGRQTIALPHEELDEAHLRAYTQRASVRDYLPDPVPFASFGDFLRSLTPIDAAGVPKYRYASGGGLYPVQTYLYIKPGRVEGVPGGVYYHHPQDHSLVLLSAEARLDADTQMPHNRAMFDKAAFVIFLIGQLAAVQPLYGGLARDFCLLEAGYLSQLLMSVAPAHGIGLCPVGAMDFETVRPLFDLGESHIIAHLLFGGLAGEPQALPAARVDLADQLRDLVDRKLPRHMHPSAYVLLDSLPITGNGKVDRRSLAEPEHGAEPARAHVPPRTDIERRLAVIAQEVLGCRQPGVDQNFFDLGGTSIHMVQILNKVCVAFEREVPVTEVFRHPTIGSLAAYLDGEDGAGADLSGSDERAELRKQSLARRSRPRPGQAGAQRP